MTVNEALRLVAGIMVLISLLLTQFSFTKLDMVYGFYWCKFITIIIYKMVSNDDNTKKARFERWKS